MINTRQAALYELKQAEKSLSDVSDFLTIQNMRMIIETLKQQQIALRRVFEYSDAVALGD